MAKTMCFVNQKGGVGKTTLTEQMAGYLKREGKKVLLVDIDPQGNLTSWTGASVKEDNTLFEVLLEEKKAEEVLISTEYGDILPIDENCVFRKQEVDAKTFRESLLKKAISSISKNYDYILIDCPPDVDVLFYNAILVSDKMVVVCLGAVDAGTGATKIINQANLVSEGLGKITETVVVFNMVDSTNVCQVLVETIKKSLKGTEGAEHVTIVEAGISRGCVAEESKVYKQTIYDYSPKSKLARDFDKVCKEIVLSFKESK